MREGTRKFSLLFSSPAFIFSPTLSSLPFLPVNEAFDFSSDNRVAGDGWSPIPGAVKQAICLRGCGQAWGHAS